MEGIPAFGVDWNGEGEIMCQSNECSHDDWLRFDKGIKIFQCHLAVGFPNFFHVHVPCIKQATKYKQLN